MYFAECNEQCDLDYSAMLDWQHSLNPATDDCRVTSSPKSAMCSSLNRQSGDERVLLHSQDYSPGFRQEHDSLGEKDIPIEAYWGIHTSRALENFQLSEMRLSQFPALLRAYASIKLAAVRVNARLGVLNAQKAQAIERACRDLESGSLDKQFPIDVFQGGAGTSTNMNVNEVLANRALEYLNRPKGDYDALHPNDDVNLSQSTNDTYPTAIRIATLRLHNEYRKTLCALAIALEERGTAFNDVIKLGRTQLQDAVPMTLGQEFKAFASAIRKDVRSGDIIVGNLHETNLGGTAIGTGINAPEGYAAAVISELNRLTGLPLKLADDLVSASWDVSALVLYSGWLRQSALTLSKLANDLRLLSSGPRGGIGEITLPSVQAGSSIMPGKVNPVIAEAINQIAFQVMGNDVAIGMAAEAGQLQLNAMEPLIAFNLLSSLQLLINGVDMLTSRCIRGILANPNACRQYLDRSVCLATALVPLLGYEAAARMAHEALQSGKTIRNTVIEHGLMEPLEADDALDAGRMLGR
jgi:aspartate ammonia-lyase